MKKKNKNLDVVTIFESPKWLAFDKHIDAFSKHIISDCLKYNNIESLAKKIEVSVVFSDDEEIQVLNKQYRGKDKPTNVLSFPQEDFFEGNLESELSNPKLLHLGDIVLSFTTIQAEALAQDKDFMDHLAHMLVHGVLHLLGFDHENDDEASQMENLEIEILGGFGIRSPY